MKRILASFLRTCKDALEYFCQEETVWLTLLIPQLHSPASFPGQPVTSLIPMPACHQPHSQANLSLALFPGQPVTSLVPRPTCHQPHSHGSLSLASFPGQPVTSLIPIPVQISCAIHYISQLSLSSVIQEIMYNLLAISSLFSAVHRTRQQ